MHANRIYPLSSIGMVAGQELGLKINDQGEL